MSGRQGGKLKPLKAPKKDKKEETDDEIAFKEKKKAEAEALKAAREKGVYLYTSYMSGTNPNRFYSTERYVTTCPASDKVFMLSVYRRWSACWGRYQEVGQEIDATFCCYWSSNTLCTHYSRCRFCCILLNFSALRRVKSAAGNAKVEIDWK
ncbi:translation machinery associated TMA7-domain-containing protein [Mucidula mucida]|nr:translation machinery associated TMA7-domain-containing protein [Mucidula mucida]